MPQHSKRSQWTALGGASLLLALIGCVDTITGYQATLSVFYAAPILVVVRYCPISIGLPFALCCTGVWWLADGLAGHVYPSSMIRVWEISIRSGFFFAVAIAGTSVREQQDAAQAKIALLEHSRALEQQIIEVSEYEQRRIGRDLHDGLCQYLAAVACSASSLRRELDEQQLPQFASRAGELAELVSNGVVETRNLSHSLMPVEIGHGGLAVALQELADSTHRLVQIDCIFEYEGAELAHHDGNATHLFRIAQEAVNNAARHGKAKQIAISLTTNEHAATLSVTDDGLGMVQTAGSTNGMGISIMRYRASALGGELIVENRLPHGTIISCAVPAPELEEALS